MARHLKLIIDVAYEYEDGIEIDNGACVELADILHSAAERLAEQGLLSDEHPAIVTEWSAHVEY